MYAAQCIYVLNYSTCSLENKPRIKTSNLKLEATGVGVGPG